MASIWKPRVLLITAVALVLFVALGKLFAVLGPPLIIYSVAHPSGVGFSWITKAYALYTNEIAKTAGIPERQVHIGLWFSFVVFGVFGLLGILTAARKRLARLLLLGLCACLFLFHAAAIARSGVMLSVVLDQGEWLLLYGAIMFVLTRESVCKLFVHPAKGSKT